MLGALRDLATEIATLGSLPPTLIFQKELVPFLSDKGRSILGALKDLATETAAFGSLSSTLTFQEEIIPCLSDAGKG